MNDQELAAEARRVGYLLRRCSGDVDRLAGALLAELADRLDARAAAGARASQAADVIVLAWCKGCERGTTSVPCGRCGGPACAGCGRCPPCDGDLPAAEE